MKTRQFESSVFARLHNFNTKQFLLGLALIPAALAIMLPLGCHKPAADEIDFGTIRNSVYSNSYFGLKVDLPPGWSIQDQETQQRVQKTGLKAIAGDDKNLNATLKAAEIQTVSLFAVSKHPLGAPVTFNPNLLAIAERVRHMPGIQRGKDYHFHSRKLLESSQMRVSFPQEITTEKLGGVDFDVMYLEMSVPGKTIQQKHYVTIWKGYALAFISTFTTENEEATLRKVLDTVSFNR